MSAFIVAATEAAVRQAFASPALVAVEFDRFLKLFEIRVQNGARIELTDVAIEEVVSNRLQRDVMDLFNIGSNLRSLWPSIRRFHFETQESTVVTVDGCCGVRVTSDNVVAGVFDFDRVHVFCRLLASRFADQSFQLRRLLLVARK